MEIGVTPRRHNPVDSICRKLQTIQRRDQEVNSPFQIPKFQSSSYDSPHSGLRLNLEAILKKRGVQPEGDTDCDTSEGMLTPTASPAPGPASRTPHVPITPANATYNITSMLGTLGTQGDRTPHSRAYRRNCSTPAVQAGDSYFNFTPRYSNQTPLEGSNTDMKSTKTSNPNLRAYNLNFSSDISNMDSELAFPTLLVKRLSLGEGSLLPSESKKENLAEVSLICEEDLLDTIFQACDTQGKGKVYVSHIVDFLRNTTCRTSEDCGLEELCNMLDPEQKDISIDLDTYHAIMKEWIEDCRSQEKDSKSDTHQESFIQRDSFLARRSALLNMTSGSLEAFGGEVSRADLETSDLVFCVADLQFNNQKLQEEIRKMKQVAESMEDTNQKLIEENEELKAQAKVGQQLLQKEKMLKEELEEMKVSLTASEENRAQASAQKQQMGRENQSLISKIADLQEENLKVTFEAEENQKKMHDLWDHNADLQVQVNSFNVILAEKESMIQERNKQIEELKLAVMEYSSVTELLRADKNKLEVQIQMMQPDVTIPGLSLSVAYRLNQMSSGCLQTELALAQNPLEGLESMSSSVCFASSLDETLDREVLLLLQGPTPEQLSMEFKTLISRLKKEFKHDSLSFLSAFRRLPENKESLDASTDLKMQSLEMQVEQRRSEWTHSLDQLDQYTDSLEKELLKMASNLRRSRTEILHLSGNVQEQENQKQQLREELDRLKTPVDSRETSCQTLDLEQQNTPVQEIFLEISCDIEMYQHKNKMKSIEEFFGGSKGEAEAAQDSGVETGELQRDMTFSLTSVTDNSTETEPQDASFEDEEGMPRPYVVKENARLPECTRLEDAHGQAAPVLHTKSLCAGQSFEIKTPQELVSQGSFPVTNDVVSTSEVDPAATDVVQGRNLPLGTTIGGAGFERLLDMSDFERLSEKELSKGSAKSDKSPLLPVAEEEEAMPEISTSYPSTPDKDRSVPTKILASSGSNTIASNVLQKDPPDNFKDETLEPTASEGKKDPHPQRNKFKKEMSSMEAIEEHKAQEDNDESVSTEKGIACVTSEDSSKDENISLSPNDKEIEAEFHRLSLGFKCDMFTLEKRLRLEERSRDLAEENVRKEVNSCQGLLQGLIPRCEEDNQSMEIIHRLQKNLEILMQSMTRVSSRSEMLGAIHQESRVGKGVEVMIQHVENLRRMYTKEHAELLELRENLVPNEKPFGGHVERDDFRNKKPPSNMFKTTSRRISIAYIPRSGGSIPSDAPKDTAETDVERFSRRSPWNMAAKRPPLKRFISSGTWADVDEPALMNRCGYDTDSQSEEERKEEPEDRRSSLTELGIRITSFILQATTASSTDRVSTSVVEGRPAAPRPTRGVWIWLALFVVLAVLLALLASLMLQPVADAAPVGTGDSWTTIQQLLWPYTGLRHNGQPPV